MRKWHYSLNGQQCGPVSAIEIRKLQAAGTLNALSLVWCSELTEWIALGTVSTELLPPGDPSAQTAAVTTTEERRYPFEFHGRATEYFRIWIVNVVLTVLTLGIYAAWAKVRTRRYFYGNTLLDGKPFDFTGRPMAILKGNLIFGGLFALYSVTLQLYPPVGLGILLLIFCIMPLLIQKALRFRAHNTVHRNVRLNFRGNLGEAYRVFLGLLFLVPFTLGLIFPYLQFRQKRYLLNNVGWGSAEATMTGKSGYFYKTFFKSFGLVIVMSILAGFAAPIYLAFQKGGAETKAVQSSAPALSADATQAPTASDTSFQTEFDKAYNAEFNKAYNDKIAANPDLSDDQKEELLKSRAKAQEITTMAMLSIIPIYLSMFLVAIYYHVRTSNYCINTTQWGQLGHLESTVRVRDYLWLLFTNGLAVLFSLGLLIPWVKIRMARYVASKTTLMANGNLDAVAKSLGGDESALGDSGADIFDFEVGF